MYISNDLHLPELFGRPRQNAVFQQFDRCGISVVALPTTELRENELLAVLRFRLAEYMRVGFADPKAVHAAALDHEPLSSLSPHDLHLLAGSTADGALLCYIAVRAVQPALPAVRMRSRVRPLFPVEESHGAGIFDRVPILAGLQAAKVRELGRFIKSHGLHAHDELGARAPVETILALVRVLAGPLRSRVDALIGEAEAGVAMRNLDFFDFPTIVVGGTIPFDPESSYLHGHENRDFYPFAGLIADLVEHTLPRAAAIESALVLPGRHGVRGLLALRRSAAAPRSRLAPRAGLPPLTADKVSQSDVPIAARRALRAAGSALRQVEPFNRLTVAEATVLRTLMRRRSLAAGESIIRRGDEGDALYVLEDGAADVRVGPRSLRRLKPGTCFGEIAPLYGVRRTVDVVALRPSTLLELSAETYRHYLATIPGIEREFLALGALRLSS